MGLFDAYYVSVPLPTEQMVEKAVAGGHGVRRWDNHRVLILSKTGTTVTSNFFQAVLVTPHGETFGRIEVPLLSRPI